MEEFASSMVATFSPRRSRLTLKPCSARFSAVVIDASRVSPAMNRLTIGRKSLEFLTNFLIGGRLADLRIRFLKSIAVDGGDFTLRGVYSAGRGSGGLSENTEGGDFFAADDGGLRESPGNFAVVAGWVAGPRDCGSEQWIRVGDFADLAG